MTKPLVLIALLASACICSMERVLACGDKFLVISRGTRFERPVVRAPAGILVYARPGDRFGNDAAIDAALAKAGYQVTRLTTEADFMKALANGSWDLLVADVAVVRSLPTRLSRPPTGAILPGVADSSPAELKSAKSEFGRVLKLPTNSRSMLWAVDDALAARNRSAN